MANVAQVLGNRLRELRKARGLSQEELAEKSALSINAISSFERGMRFPRSGSLDALLHALGKEANELFSWVPAARESETVVYKKNRKQRIIAEIVEILENMPKSSLYLIKEILQRISLLVNSK